MFYDILDGVTGEGPFARIVCEFPEQLLGLRQAS